MTLEEAHKIVAITDSADHYCTVCAKELRLQLNEAFPGFDWLAMPPTQPRYPDAWADDGEGAAF